jgi:hypothetical protein
MRPHFVAPVAHLGPLLLAVANAPAGCASGPAVHLQPEVVVLAAGTEPRQPLRYQIGAGPHDDLMMDLVFAMAEVWNRGHGDSKPTTLVRPNLRMLMSVVVASVDNEGTATVRTTVTAVQLLESADAQPAVTDGLREEVQGLVGLTNSMRVSPRGVVTDSRLESAPHAAASLRGLIGAIRSALEGLVSPFPAEALGPSARWQVRRQEVDHNDVQVDRTAVFTLERREAGRAYLRMVENGYARPQRLPPTGLPPDSTLMLHRFSSTREARMVVSPQTPLARSRVSVHANTDSTVSSPLRSTTRHVGVNLEFSTYPASPRADTGGSGGSTRSQQPR